MGDSPFPILRKMKLFAALLLAAVMASATEFDALSTYQAADWSQMAEVTTPDAADDAPTMSLMDAVEELRSNTPENLKEHVNRVAKHASLIQSADSSSTTTTEDRAKAYAHNFSKSKKALHSALNMLVSELKAGHKHDVNVLKQTKRSLEAGLNSGIKAAAAKTKNAKHKVCPLQRTEEKTRAKRNSAYGAMMATGRGKVCPLSTTLGDMDIDKNVPAFGVALRNKWDRVKAKFVKQNKAHNAARKAHEAAKRRVTGQYAALRTAVKLEASNSHRNCQNEKREYELLKKDVFSNVKTRKSVATSVLVVKCYVNHITNNNASRNCANRARRQSQAIWNIRAPAWKNCASVASFSAKFGPVGWKASYRNCAGHRREVAAKEKARKRAERAKKEKTAKEKKAKARERAAKEKAKKRAERAKKERIAKEKKAKAKVRELKKKEELAKKKEVKDKAVKKEKAAKKEAARVKELKAKVEKKQKAEEKKAKAVARARAAEKKAKAAAREIKAKAVAKEKAAKASVNKRPRAGTIKLAGDARYCLNLHNYHRANGGHINLWSCNGHNSQNWYVSANGGEIKLNADRRWCLNLHGYHRRNGGTVNLWSCNGHNSQKWLFQANGVVALKADPNWCLNLHGYARRNGGTVNLWRCNGHASQKWKRPAVEVKGPKPGYYKIETTGVHAGHSAGQPAGWGLSAWGAHGAVRNHASSWAAVHSGNHWPMVWKIEKSTRVHGAYFIKTTQYGPASGHMKAGWGLSSWHAHGAVRNGASSRVAVHSGNYWLMDWKIQPSTRTKGAWTIKTDGGPAAGKQPKGWGLSAWQKHGGRRNSASSWVYTHSGNHWLMDWKLVPWRKPHGKLTCHTATRHSNAAGVIVPATPGGYVMTGGGMNNHYRHWNHLSAFEEMFPHGNSFRCDTGFGPGRLTCYTQSCKTNVGALSCTTRSTRFTGSGLRQATLPAGYTMTGGGLYNHYRHFNARAGFEDSSPHGNNAWRGDMGFGWGDYTVYVRGCKAPHPHRLTCTTRASGRGNAHNIACPGGYTLTGCGQINHYRGWNAKAGFEQVHPHGNGCFCDSGFGHGDNQCFARCCKLN